MSSERRAAPASPPASPLPQLPPDRPPESADFDFLIGEWRIESTRFAADGTELACLPGRWHAEPRHDGRILLDEVVVRAPAGDAVVARFSTLRTWSPATERWEMTFLSAHQPVQHTSFHGVRRGDEMTLEATARGSSGEEVHARVRFFAIGPDGFQWEQRQSDDGGRSWWRPVHIRAWRN